VLEIKRKKAGVGISNTVMLNAKILAACWCRQEATAVPYKIVYNDCKMLSEML